jgi:hypothetical protein
MRGCGRVFQLRRERPLAGVSARLVLAPSGAGGAAGAHLPFSSIASSLVSPGERADPVGAGPAGGVCAVGPGAAGARVFDAG